MGLYVAFKTDKDFYDVYKHGTGELCGALLFEARLTLAQLMKQYPAHDTNEFDCPLCHTRGAMEYRTVADSDVRRQCLRFDFLRSVVGLALTGGIVPTWAEIRNITKGHDGSYRSFEVKELNDSTADWHLIDDDAVEKAIAKVSAGTTPLPAGVRAIVEAASNGNDGSRLDAAAANFLVQIAAFGEVVMT